MIMARYRVFFWHVLQASNFLGAEPIENTVRGLISDLGRSSLLLWNSQSCVVCGWRVTVSCVGTTEVPCVPQGMQHEQLNLKCHMMFKFALNQCSRILTLYHQINQYNCYLLLIKLLSGLRQYLYFAVRVSKFVYYFLNRTYNYM